MAIPIKANHLALLPGLVILGLIALMPATVMPPTVLLIISFVLCTISIAYVAIVALFTTSDGNGSLQNIKTKSKKIREDIENLKNINTLLQERRQPTLAKETMETLEKEV
jgi:hypothetical protein